MSWDKWHHDPREGEAPEEPRYTPSHPLGRELSPEETSAALRRIAAAVFARIEPDRPEHRCPHGVNLERAACGQCSPIAVER